VTAIQFTMPFFMLILAALWLGEKLTPIRIGAVVIGFAGAMLIVNPTSGGAGLTLASGAAFASALLGGVSGVIIRRLTQSDASLTIAFYFSLSATLFGACLLPYGFVWPQGMDLLALAGMGLAGGMAQLLPTQAYRYGQVSEIAPYEYSALLWAISFGWLFFGDHPTLPMLEGAALIIAADLVVLWHKQRRQERK
jgi:drug/metabolite transporter (DMT)-like permease